MNMLRIADAIEAEVLKRPLAPQLHRMFVTFRSLLSESLPEGSLPEAMYMLRQAAPVNPQLFFGAPFMVMSAEERVIHSPAHWPLLLFDFGPHLAMTRPSLAEEVENTIVGTLLHRDVHEDFIDLMRHWSTAVFSHVLAQRLAGSSYYRALLDQRRIDQAALFDVRLRNRSPLTPPPLAIVSHVLEGALRSVGDDMSGVRRGLRETYGPLEHMSIRFAHGPSSTLDLSELVATLREVGDELVKKRFTVLNHRSLEERFVLNVQERRSLSRAVQALVASKAPPSLEERLLFRSGWEALWTAPSSLPFVRSVWAGEVARPTARRAPVGGEGAIIGRSDGLAELLRDSLIMSDILGRRRGGGSIC